MQKVIALSLATLLLFPAGSFGQATVVTLDQWTTVADVLPGTRLRIELIDGPRLEGRLVGRVQPDIVVLRDITSSGSFTISTIDGSTTFNRAKIAKIGVYPSNQYVQEDWPNDPAAVRAVILAIGSGKTINLKTKDGFRGRAKLGSINAANFTVSRGSTRTSVEYTDVTEVRPAGMHVGWWIAILAPTAVILVSVIWVNNFTQ